MAETITEVEWRRLSGAGDRTPPNLEPLSRSEGDLSRNSYRPSKYPRLAKRAVGNDDGSDITEVTDERLAAIYAEIGAIRTILERPTPSASPTPIVRQFFTSKVEVPGIGLTVAYAALDAFGTEGIFDNVPESGVIQTIYFYDLDDEGVAKTLFLFSSTFTETTDNAALGLADAAQVAEWAGYISIPAANFLDAGGFRLGIVTQLNLDFRAPERKLFWQFRTEGADNIAAGAVPMVQVFGTYLSET